MQAARDCAWFPYPNETVAQFQDLVQKVPCSTQSQKAIHQFTTWAGKGNFTMTWNEIQQAQYNVPNIVCASSNNCVPC